MGPGRDGNRPLVRAVALSDVLADAGVQDAASHVEFLGADRSEEAVPPQPSEPR